MLLMPLMRSTSGFYNCPSVGTIAIPRLSARNDIKRLKAQDVGQRIAYADQGV